MNIVKLHYVALVITGTLLSGMIYPAFSSQIRDIVISPGLTLTPLEASGITYLDELKSFLVISDDTENKRPDLFLMDTSGRITNRTTIKGLKKINDMESISLSGPDHLYTLSSQSYNKKGIQSPARTLFVQIKRNNNNFECTGSVTLLNLLLSASTNAPKEKWAQFIQKANSNKSIDIEGMAVFKDTLLLGFKDPKINNHAVILAISEFNSVFTSGNLSVNQISLWKKLSLYDTATATYCGISDMTVYNNEIYGVSTGVATKNGVNKDVGLLWKYSPSTDSIRIIRNFIGIKPEGITIFGDPSRYCIVFDNGTEVPSQFLIDTLF